MKDVKVAIPTQNMRVSATGGKNNKKGTQAAKPNGLECYGMLAVFGENQRVYFNGNWGI